MGMKTVQDASLTSVADAIRVKAEIEGTLEFPAQFISAIRNIPTGGGSVSVPPKDVNFYDYDGTIVDAYTASDFASLSAMPQNPKHSGLTAQGWNWSLADAKAYVAKYGRLNIGQMYVTTSGDTEIDIELYDGRLEPVLGIFLNGTVEIDWGDGSAVDTVVGTSLSTNIDTKHIYASGGKYTIKLHVASGSFVISSTHSYGGSLIHKESVVNVSEWVVYSGAVCSVRLGMNVSIGQNAFYGYSGLLSITIPNGVTIIKQNAFYNCYALSYITIPNSVTTIEQNAFYNCYALSYVSIPDSVGYIQKNAFYYCRNLGYVTLPRSFHYIQNETFANCFRLSTVIIPENVVGIKNNAFNYCTGIKKIILKPTTPPTLSNASAFSSMASDRIFIVPAGTLEAYQTASNWSSYANYMQEEA